MDGREECERVSATDERDPTDEQRAPIVRGWVDARRAVVTGEGEHADGYRQALDDLTALLDGSFYEKGGAV